MASTGQNFELYQGDDKELVITVRDNAGALVDLTGYSAVWCVHIRTPDNIVLEKTTSDGITIPTPGNGQLIVEIDGTDTAELLPRNYDHQCEVEDPSGHHTTVSVGYMKLLKSVTHDIL